MIDGQKIRFITLSLFPSTEIASSLPSSTHSLSFSLTPLTLFSLILSGYIKAERGREGGRKERDKVGKEELSAMHETDRYYFYCC